MYYASMIVGETFINRLPRVKGLYTKQPVEESPFARSLNQDLAARFFDFFTSFLPQPFIGIKFIIQNRHLIL